LLTLEPRKACFWMISPPFLIKQLYRCGLVATASFVGAGCATRS
jgi:hypothetical protein